MRCKKTSWPPGHRLSARANLRIVGGWDKSTSIYLAVGGLALAMGLALAKWESTTYLFVAATTTAATLVSLHFRKPSHLWPWLCILAAFILFICTGALQAEFHTLGNLSATRSLVPDAIALPGYIILAFGLMGFSRGKIRSGEQISILLDGCIAALALASLAYALVEPVLSKHQMAAAVRLVFVAYPSMSICLVVMTLRIVLSVDGKRFPAFWLCVSAMLAMFVGDTIYMVADLNLLHIPAQLLDLPYGIALLGAGAAAVHPSMRELTERSATKHFTASAGRTALIAGGLLVSAANTGLLAFPPAGFPIYDSIVLLVLSLLLTGAVVLRLIQAMHVAARSENRLAFQANHDSLTGLPNRRMVEQHLSKQLERRTVDDTHVAVLFLDLDRFKLVNDSLGHNQGDQLLIEVSQRLQASLRPDDLVSRMGGDEFMVLLEHVVTTSEAVNLAERLRASLLDPFILNGVTFYISGSVGLAFASGDDPTATAEALVRNADTAMYQAKEAGRDSVVVFDDSMREQVFERVHLERDLRRAVSSGQLRVHYQPIVGLPHGRAIGVEALVRWQHPTRGLLYPSQFIPLAEDIGAIGAIGTWVLETVVDQWASWKRQTGAVDDMYVSLNLSNGQLRDDTIVTRVAELLKANGLAGSSLCLELTESLAMQDPILSAELLGRLRRLDVGVALDDFGAEYSSLSHLRRLPASMLKIDKSFVDGLLYEDIADTSLITAVVAIARSLGITTVAEGVESSFQAARLLSLRVDAVQGYFYSCPVTPDRLIDTVESLGARALRPGSAPIG